MKSRFFPYLDKRKQHIKNRSFPQHTLRKSQVKFIKFLEKMNITPNPEKLPTIAGNSALPQEKRKRGRPRKNPIPPEKLNIPNLERVKETIKGGNIKGVKGNKRKSEYIYPPSTGSNNTSPTPTQSIYISPEDKDKRGLYNRIADTQVQRILQLLTDGYDISEIAKKENIAISTLYNWKDKNTHQFGDIYAHTRETRADRMAKEIQQIADNADERSSAAVNKARLQTDIRKWLLAHQYPEKYGDNINIECKSTLRAEVGLAAIAEVNKIRAMLADDSEQPEIIDAEEVK